MGGERFKHVLHVFEFFSLEGRVDPVDHVVVRLLLLLFHHGDLEVLLSIGGGITVNGTELSYLRLLAVAFGDSCERRGKRLRNLRFHHFVESLAHFFFMVCLDLAHRRDVPL